MRNLNDNSERKQMSNLDLEIKKALNNKLELDKFTQFTVNANAQIKIEFTVVTEQNNQRVIKATYEEMPHLIQRTHKNVTITYYSWNDGLSEEVTDEITIHYETKRIIDKNDELAPIVKEMTLEIINAKNKHMPN